VKVLAAVLAVLVLAAAFAIGWTTTPAPPPQLVLLAGRTGTATVDLADPNPRARTGLAMIAGGLTDPVAVASQADPDAARPVVSRPPEPDLANAFRRQLSAVVAQKSGGPFYALLRGDEGGGRVLRPGETFQSGWKLARLSLAEAVFARGRETRAVDLFAQPAAAAPAPAPAAAPEPDAASSTPDGVSAPPLA
jgi:hypothetical protein